MDRHIRILKIKNHRCWARSLFFSSHVMKKSPLRIKSWKTPLYLYSSRFFLWSLFLVLHFLDKIPSLPWRSSHRSVTPLYFSSLLISTSHLTPSPTPSLLSTSSLAEIFPSSSFTITAFVAMWEDQIICPFANSANLFRFYYCLFEWIWTHFFELFCWKFTNLTQL